MAHIIVFGNEKGGSGKSTTAMHVLTALLWAGKTVGALDLDTRQSTLFRYLENRKAYKEASHFALPEPERYVIKQSYEDSRSEANTLEEAALTDALDALDHNDFIVIDCPGSHTHLATLAHSAAHTLVTPMNDSMIDFDLLARIDPETNRVIGPSIYSEIVWKARQVRMKAQAKPLEWIVIRNRLSMLDAHNKRNVGSALKELSKRIGFRVEPGFSERVIFRELFPKGLTLLDLDMTKEKEMTMSNIAARQEVRTLVKALNLPGFENS